MRKGVRKGIRKGVRKGVRKKINEYISLSLSCIYIYLLIVYTYIYKWTCFDTSELDEACNATSNLGSQMTNGIGKASKTEKRCCVLLTASRCSFSQGSPLIHLAPSSGRCGSMRKRTERHRKTSAAMPQSECTMRREYRHTLFLPLHFVAAAGA